jgi:hypothetical protein
MHHPGPNLKRTSAQRVALIERLLDFINLLDNVRLLLRAGLVLQGDKAAFDVLIVTPQAVTTLLGQSRAECAAGWRVLDNAALLPFGD